MSRPFAAPETEAVEHEQLVPLYRVVLLDDNDHTYDYVIEMLQKIFIFTLDQAYRHAEEVDRAGRTRTRWRPIRSPFHPPRPRSRKFQVAAHFQHGGALRRG